MKEQVYIILASQDFDVANHRNLWIEIAESSGCQVYVANIMADWVTSLLKRKFSRLKEAMAPAVRVNEHLTVFRPFVVARPEILPNRLFSIVRKGFWKSMRRVDPNIMNKHINVIVYNAYWVEILKESHPDMKIAYYLFDEVRYNGKDNSIDKARYRHDEYACKHSDIIYTMTKVLAESRTKYNRNIYVMGNGATLPSNTDVPQYVFSRSVAFIGNFRDWIDEVMLENIIKLRPQVLFVFAGPVEDNMRDYLKNLLNRYNNTAYFGRVSKERMTHLYRMFNMVIIPYRQNPFVQATRPIKIVESVLAGTPVVTIPMDGYSPSDFIRFASNEAEFTSQIDDLLEYTININSTEYKQFCINNTWQAIAERIIATFSNE